MITLIYIFEGIVLAIGIAGAIWALNTSVKQKKAREQKDEFLVNATDDVLAHKDKNKE